MKPNKPLRITSYVSESIQSQIPQDYHFLSTANLDAEIDMLLNAWDGLIDWLALFLNADGSLANGLIHWDNLSAELQLQFTALIEQAQAAQTEAEQAAVQAEAAALLAEAALEAMQSMNLYLGVYATDPTARPTSPSSPLQGGEIYLRTPDMMIRQYLGPPYDTWRDLTRTVSVPSTSLTWIYAPPAGTTVIEGTDLFGNVLYLDAAASNPVQVFLNGVRLIEDNPANPLPPGTPATPDFTVDYNNQRILLSDPLPADTIVQVDALLSGADVALASADITYLTLTPAPDGVTTDFDLLDNATAQPIPDTNAMQVRIHQDGVTQRPSVDYSVSGSQLQMTAPPPADATLWGIYYAKLSP